MPITPAHPRTLHSPQNICSAHHPIITTLLQPTPTSFPVSYPTPFQHHYVRTSLSYPAHPFPKTSTCTGPYHPISTILYTASPSVPNIPIPLQHPYLHTSQLPHHLSAPPPFPPLTPPQNLDLHLSLLLLFPPFYTPPPTTSPSPPLYITPCLFNHASPPLHHSTPSQHPHLHLPVTPPSPPIYITPPPTLPFPPLLSTFISIPSPSSHLQLPSTSISISSPLAPSSFCNHFF